MENLDDIIGRKIIYKKATTIRDKFAYIVDRDPLNNNFMALFEDERTIWVNPGDFKLKDTKFAVEIKEYATKDQVFLPCFVFDKAGKKIIINRPNYSDETASVKYATNNAIESLIPKRFDFPYNPEIEESLKISDQKILDKYSTMISDRDNSYHKDARTFIQLAKDLAEPRTIKISGEQVNQPSHYQGNKFEVIDIIEDFDLGFHLGNVQKYLLRAGRKNPEKTLEDLKKAQYYLNRYINNLEKQNE